MSSVSRPAATSNPPVDLEKGLEAAATDQEETELAVVNPCLATCIRATMNVVVAAYMLFVIGVMVAVVKISEWGPWRGVYVLFCSAALLWTLLSTPKVKEILVKTYATKHTLASDSDVSTKLLASSKK